MRMWMCVCVCMQKWLSGESVEPGGDDLLRGDQGIGTQIIITLLCVCDRSEQA